MRCPVCDALHLENSLACEAEATAILQQRYEMIGGDPQNPSPNQFKESQDIVVSSRHRQLKIASKLENHRALAHSA